MSKYHSDDFKKALKHGYLKVETCLEKKIPLQKYSTTLAQKIHTYFKIRIYNFRSMNHIIETFYISSSRHQYF